MRFFRSIDIAGLCISFITFIYFSSFFPTNTLYSLLNILLGFILLTLLFLSGRNPFDLRQIFYLANFIFLVLAARIDKSLGLLYWGTPYSTLARYEDVTLLSIFAIFCFAVAHLMGQKLGQRISFLPGAEEHETCRMNISGFALIVLSLCSVAVIYQQNSWEIYSVFFRSGVGVAREFGSGTTELIYRIVLFPLPAICLVMYLLHGKRSVWITSLLIILMFIGNPPTGMSRWQAAMLYGAVAITGIPFVFQRRLVFAYTLFLGLFLLFPILDAFRRYTGEVRIRLTADWLTAGHLDSAQSIARAIDFEFVTHGRQLLGALFFFVPRQLWPDKPIGSGHEISRMLNLSLENISMHFFGEGFVNFGFVGVFLFSIFLGLILGLIDQRAWKSGYRSPILLSCYPFLVGWIFFFVRGDMMSSFGYMIGTVTTISCVYIVMRSLSRLSVRSSRQPGARVKRNILTNTQRLG